MELEVLHEGVVVDTLPVAEAAVHVGRAPVNELVLRDPGVSSHHAVVWVEAGIPWLRDLGSTNGTFVNEARLVGSVALQDGDRIRLGPRVTLRLRGIASEAPAIGPLRVEVCGTDLAWGVTSDRFAIPGDADLALLLFPDGDVWLAEDGLETRQVVVDQPFQAGDRTLVLRADATPTPETLRPAVTPYDYALVVRLDASRAELEDRRSGARALITTDNRVALLFALGERWERDGPGDGRGWLDDGDAAVAIWGRGRAQHGPNNYNVLVHRVRQELEAAGLDRWCIEKRSGRTRLRVTHVDVREGEPE